MSTPECPDPTVIGSLLHGTLVGPERADVLRHVEACPSCRTVLDRLTDQTREVAPARPDRLAVTQAEDAPETAPPEQTQVPLRADPALPFLDPPGREGSLGRLGPYEILQVLGQGAVGVVLKGYEPRLRRFVAVKVLAPQLTHSLSARRRFAREGKATAALDHENIVTVHAVEDQGPRPYLVMEYVPGGSLQQRLDRGGALPVAEAVRIAAGLAAGLAAAHANGLIHRDVKPGNVLLEAETGRVKLTDFGLVQEEQGAVSQTDVLAGTPLYMSPEQARGERVDARSDLFSLGSVLYAMCSGRPPFSGRNPLAVLRQISEAAPTPLKRVNPAIPDWLGELIARLHARDPASRPAAAEVARILQERQADPSLRGRPPRRRRLVLALAVLGLAGLAVAGLSGPTNRLDGVLRWWRNQGTLAVTNDDPDAVIRLAGREEELVGEGSAEWTVPAGEYLLLTSRPGESRREETVKVERGARQEVHAEWGGKSAGAGPFVLLSRQDKRERAYPSLHEAILHARAGETVEVRGNGPFLIPPLRITRPLRIRAGAGFEPLLRHDGKDLKAIGIDTARPLVLEGLLIEGAGFPSWKEGHFQLVRCVGAPLGVAGCRLQVRRDGSCIVFEGTHLELRRSLLLRGQSGHGAINWNRRPASRVVLDGCVIGGGHSGVSFGLLPSDRAGTLLVRRSTLAPQDAFTLHGNASWLLKNPPAAPFVNIDIADSVLGAWGNVLHFEQPPSPGEAPPAFGSSQRLLTKLVSYRDRGSFYPRLPTLLGLSSEWKPLPAGRNWATLREWWAFWGQPEVADALQAPVAFHGKDVRARLIKDVASVTPTDFQLSAGSPGRGAAPDGSDFGADSDLVGPGPAYQRWRQTPEYRAWQKQADQILANKEGRR
jgi:hypothetical protein